MTLNPFHHTAWLLSYLKSSFYPSQKDLYLSSKLLLKRVASCITLPWAFSITKEKIEVGGAPFFFVTARR
jgi:hypothetical protein